jgi:hypothetical protein
MRKCGRACVLILGIGFLALPRLVYAQRTNITIDSVLRALTAGDIAINYKMREPARHDELLLAMTHLRELGVADLTIDEFLTAASEKNAEPGFLEILRWDRDRQMRLTQAAVRSANTRLKEVTILQLPQNATRTAPQNLGQSIYTLMPQQYETYMGSTEKLETSAQKLANAASTDKLRRYELKFGAASPRLNPVETAINYFLERADWMPEWLPFAPGVSGPGSLEFVASYSNSDLTGTVNPIALRVISGVHIGFRHYVFDTTSARGTIEKLLNPATKAAGLSVFSPTDLPLDSPLKAGRRWGAFIDWGSVRTAAAFGHDWRAIVGTQAQLIPHLF